MLKSWLHNKFFFWLEQVDPLSALYPILFMRWVIVVGVLLRLSVTYYDFTATYLLAWRVVVVLLVAYTAIITYEGLRHPNLREHKGWNLLQVLLDTAFFSVLLLLTQKHNSDLFLLYFLPLLIAATHFKARNVAALFVFISAAYFIVSWIVAVPAGMVSTLFWNFLPRWSFFLFVLFLAFVRGNVMKAQASELETLRSTAISMSRDEAIGDRFRVAMDAAVRLLWARGAVIYLLTPKKDTLRVEALVGLRSEKYGVGFQLSVGLGLAWVVVNSKRAIIENNYAKSENRVPILEDLFSAVVEVPLIFKEEVLGVLAVFDDSRYRKFKKKDIPVLERLAQHCSAAIHEIRVVEKLDKQARALRVLNEANEKMNLSLDIRHTASVISEYASNLCIVYSDPPPIFTCVGAKDVRSKDFQVLSTYPVYHLAQIKERILREGKRIDAIGIVGRAIRTGLIQVVPDAVKDEDYFGYSEHTKSQLTVPIKVRREVLGFISVEQSAVDPFGPDFKTNMEVLASQAATAFSNALLFDEIRRQKELASLLHSASVAISDLPHENRT